MTKTLTVANIPSHTHSFTTGSAGAHSHSASTGSAGNHAHTRGSMNITGSITNSASDDDLLTYADSVTSSGALSVGTSRGKRAFKIDPDTQYGYDSISFNGASGWSGATSTTGAHTHSVTVNSNGAHTHSGTTNGTGSGTALNIMPESIAVNVWKRTA